MEGIPKWKEVLQKRPAAISPRNNRRYPVRRVSRVERISFRFI